MKTFIPVFFFIFIFFHVSGQNYLGNFKSADTFCAMNGVLFFQADDGLHGAELWKTDGTNQGTVLVKDISQGFEGSFLDHLTVFNNELYFSATDHIHGSELWKSDGTEEGTVMVKDILPQFGYNNGSMPKNFILFDQSLCFTATDENGYTGIWKTNGTAEGTIIIYNSTYTGLSNITVAGNSLFFVRLSGPNQLWKLNAGTYTSQQIAIDEYYTVDELTEVNDKLFFITNTTYRRKIRLYTLDPSSGNFIMLQSYDAVLYGDQDIENLTEAAGKLFYSFRTDNDNGEYIDALWKSDGTVEGTSELVRTSYDPHMTGYHISDFFSFQDDLYFRGKIDSGYELCISDGTTGGTEAFGGIGLYYQATRFTISGDRMYFAGSGSGAGSTGPIWQSDGTSGGTIVCTALNGSLTGGLQGLYGTGENLYYWAGDGNDVALWNDEMQPAIRVYKGSTLLSDGESLQFNADTYNPVPQVTLSVKNTGGRELCLSESGVSGRDFFYSGISRVLMPGESCPFKISFFPSSLGKQAGKFRIYSNDPEYNNFEINLEGEASVLIDSSAILNDDLIFETNIIINADEDSIFLDHNELYENMPAPVLVGNLNVKGNQGNNFVYSLVTGMGDADNASFTIQGNRLYASETFDFEFRNTCTVRIKAQHQNLHFENHLIIRIKDKNDQLPGECGREFYDIMFGLKDVAYRDNQTVFAVGDDGVILRSDNDGLYWTRVNSGTKAGLLHITFVTPQVGYINTYYNQILKTANGGETWFPVPVVEEYSRYTSNHYFFNENLGFAAGPDGMISRTTDGGYSWTTTSVGYNNLLALYFVSAGTGYVCGSSGTLLKTTDGGDTWIYVDMDEFGFSQIFIDIKFTSSQVGYILTQNGKIIKTIDGGLTWSEIADVSIDSPAELLFTSESTGFIVGGDVTAYIYKTKDAGATWTRVSDNTYGQLRGIAMNPDGTHGCIAGNTWSDPGRVLYHTENQGDTWQQVFHVDGDADYSDVRYFDEQNIYVFRNFSTFLKSADGGITWQQLPLDLSSNYYECHYLSKDTIVVGDTEKWLRTDDGGMNWEIIPGIPAAVHLAVISSDRMYYTEDGEIYKTEDGGQTWQEVFTGSNSFYRIRCSGQDLVAALGYNLIVSSNNGGNDWHSYSDDWTASFRCICFINGNTLLAGGAGGMLVRSEDAGLTWSTMHTQVQEDIRGIDFTDDLHGLMQTGNSGGQGRVYSTVDGGNTWLVIGYLNTDVRNMHLLENGDAWFAGKDATIVRYSQGVNPSEAGYIHGDRDACLHCLTDYYTDVLYKESYTWEVAPAREITWNNNKASVRWSQAGTYQLTATPDAGCGPGIPRTSTVVVHDNPVAELSGLDTVFKNQELVRYYAGANPFHLFQWQVKNEKSASVISNHEISVNWGDPFSGEVTLVLTSSGTGCRSIFTKKITVLDAESVGDILNRMDVRVFPNPATDKLHIRKSNPGGGMTITLSDIQGKKLKVLKPVETGDITLDLRALSRGLYLLELQDGKKIAVIKFLKM